MATAKEIAHLLENASETELNVLGDSIYIDLRNNPHLTTEEQEFSKYFLFMISSELERRPIEPLWRKTKRFAVRNSAAIKGVGKVAACLGVGALLGVSLDDLE